MIIEAGTNDHANSSGSGWLDLHLINIEVFKMASFGIVLFYLNLLIAL